MPFVFARKTRCPGSNLALSLADHMSLLRNDSEECSALSGSTDQSSSYGGTTDETDDWVPPNLSSNIGHTLRRAFQVEDAVAPTNFVEAISSPFLAGVERSDLMDRFVFLVMSLPENQRLDLLLRLTAAFSERIPDLTIEVIMGCDVTDFSFPSQVVRRFEWNQTTEERTGRPSFEKLLKLVKDGLGPVDKHCKALYFKDRSGDHVAISTTEELMKVISQLRGNKLTLKLSPTNHSFLRILMSPRSRGIFFAFCVALTFMIVYGCAMAGFADEAMRSSASVRLGAVGPQRCD